MNQEPDAGTGVDAPAASSPEDTVVLVHGIWMHGIAMSVMAQHLRQEGFRTRYYSYDFLRLTPAENADALARDITAMEADRCHIVAHSLGGIVAMHVINRHPQLPIDKLVLLGSPVHGSEVARRIHANKLLRPLLGRSVDAGLLGGAPCGTGAHPLGIINGSGKLGLSALLYPLEEDGDGVVAATETLAEAATDVITVPNSHSSMIFSRRCAALAARFIRTASFR